MKRGSTFDGVSLVGAHHVCAPISIIHRVRVLCFPFWLLMMIIKNHKRWGTRQYSLTVRALPFVALLLVLVPEGSVTSFGRKSPKKKTTDTASVDRNDEDSQSPTPTAPTTHRPQLRDDRTHRPVALDGTTHTRVTVGHTPCRGHRASRRQMRWQLAVAPSLFFPCLPLFEEDEERSSSAEIDEVGPRLGLSLLCFVLPSSPAWRCHCPPRWACAATAAR
jgi:hypothetical protein